MPETRWTRHCRPWRVGLTADARQAIRAIRSCEPSRDLKSGKGNVSSRFPSEKVGLTIQAESHTVELAAVYEWEHGADVLEFWDQPPQMKVHGERGGRNASWRITPDYFVLHKDWAGWVECKAESFLLGHMAPEKGVLRARCRRPLVVPSWRDLCGRVGPALRRPVLCRH